MCLRSREQLGTPVIKLLAADTRLWCSLEVGVQKGPLTSLGVLKVVAQPTVASVVAEADRTLLAGNKLTHSLDSPMAFEGMMRPSAQVTENAVTKAANLRLVTAVSYFSWHRTASASPWNC